MDSATIAATAVITGSIVGALSSITSTWIVQRHQDRRDFLEREILRRETLYSDFITEVARGFLAGNRRTKSDSDTERGRTDTFAHDLYYSPEDFTVAERVTEVAAARGVKPAQIALAWILRQPGITAPIIGASKLYQLEDALAGVEITLSDEETRRLEEPYVPHAVLGL